jgi:hypothetical protein
MVLVPVFVAGYCRVWFLTQNLREVAPAIRKERTRLIATITGLSVE